MTENLRDVAVTYKPNGGGIGITVLPKATEKDKDKDKNKVPSKFAVPNVQGYYLASGPSGMSGFSLKCAAASLARGTAQPKQTVLEINGSSE